LSDTRTVATDILSITDITVGLSISGGFNGDYYAYLTHDSGFAILLNRVGRTAENPDGYPDTGMALFFEMGATNGDIHSYRDLVDPSPGPLTGIWEPDGRNISPLLSLDTTPRTALFDTFYGLNPNGQWNLFITNVSAVGVGTLESWSLEITGVVPEPSSLVLMLLAFAFPILRRRW